MLEQDAQNIASKLGAMTDEQLNVVHQQVKASWRGKSDNEICAIQKMACVMLETQIDDEIRRRAKLLISDMLTKKLEFGA